MIIFMHYYHKTFSFSNEYGISMKARITEVIENQDEKGYTMEPTFENVE